jgi:hypothetical protein
VRRATYTFWIMLFAAAVWALAAPKADKILRVAVWYDETEREAKALESEDFQVRFEGAPAKVLKTLGPEDEMLLLVVTDLTGDLALITPAKQALTDVLSKMPKHVYVGVLRAQDGARVLLDPTNDHAALVKVFDSLPVSGNAGLLDTVTTVARIADSIVHKTGVRTVVLYITDSDIRNYREDYTNPVINRSDQRDVSRVFPEGLIKEQVSKLQQQLAVLQPPIFIVHLERSIERLNQAYQAGLQQLADESGGASEFCRTRTEIPEAIRMVFRRIQNLYLLEVPLPDNHARTGQVTLQSENRLLRYRMRWDLRAR